MADDESASSDGDIRTSLQQSAPPMLTPGFITTLASCRLSLSFPHHQTPFVARQSANPMRRISGEQSSLSGSPRPPQPCRSLLADRSGEHTPMGEAPDATKKKRGSSGSTQLSQPLAECAETSSPFRHTRHPAAHRSAALHLVPLGLVLVFPAFRSHAVARSGVP